MLTASNLLADAALEAGNYFQSLPEFGPERSGAPMVAYTRISSSPIYLHNQVEEPDIVVVLDPTLIGSVDILSGLVEEGLLVLNTRMSPKELRAKLEVRWGRVCTVDATRIAMETLKRNIPNIPTMGAMLRAREVVSPEAAVNSIRTQLGKRMRESVVQANLEAFHRGYKEVQEG